MLLNPYRFNSGGTPWTPLNMANVPQIYLDMQDSSVTDISGAASAVSNLGALGTGGGFSQATADNRPTILAAELNGKRVLRFDGTNDVMVASALAARSIFKNVPVAWSFSVYKKRTLDGSPTFRYLFYSSNNASATRFAALAGSSNAGEANKPRILARRLDGDSSSSLVSSGVVQGAYAIVFSIANFATRAGEIIVNGTSAASNATMLPAAGNTSDTAANESLALCAFPTGAQASDVDLAAIIISNVAPAGGEVEKLEGWAAHKYGLTANLPGGHPYKTNPPYV